MGLVAAIAQDHKTGKILMQAWMNRESLALDYGEAGGGLLVSLQRKTLAQRVNLPAMYRTLIECRLDCDGDSLLLLVEQQGGIACHTGRENPAFIENWKRVSGSP